MYEESQINKVMTIEEILERVEKPGRYLGGEWNAIKKDPQKAKVKIALVFPDLYEIGMSYLGQKILYDILNSHPSFLAERVFAPWIDFEQELRSRDSPLFSLENRIPLSEFDIIGFSLLYELNYSNILTILDLGHIPFFNSERGFNHPLVMAGGPAAFNPEPLADIFDLFLVGDGEEAFLEIVVKYTKVKKTTKDKRAVLKELTQIKGVYVPSLYTPYQPPYSSLLAVKPTKDAPKKIEKRVLYPFQTAQFPERIVVPNVKIVFDRVAVEVERGCPQRCRFCQASNIYFPTRKKSPSYVLQNVLNSLRWTGYDDVSLTSLSVGDYPYLDQVVKILMDKLEERKISLSLSSLRPEGLSSGLAESIVRVRKTGFTLVPEAGTERLRRVINKRLEDKEIWEATENAFAQGWKLLKFYFMVGLPTERDEDLEAIVNLIKEIIKKGYRILKSAPRINLSISSFIPKPHTPFQWLKMEEEKNLREKHHFLRSRLRKYPFVRFKGHSIKNSLLEAVFSRGDRRLIYVLLEAWKRGVRFDSWKDLFRFQNWTEAFESLNMEYSRYIGALDKKAVLPWEHIETGIKKAYLLKELKKAFQEEPTASCLETACGDCQGCSYSSLVKKKFQEEVKLPEENYSLRGKKSESVFRYRAFYAKKNKTRYLSHIDLNNIIQRALRRAGIPVVHSKGFHPRMVISYLPALPLGMEGKKEAFEFKSNYILPEKEITPLINNYLPSGIEFLRLKRMSDSEPPLQRDIQSFVYSVDLEREDIKESLDKFRKESGDSSFSNTDVIRILIENFTKKDRKQPLGRIELDRKAKKLFFQLEYSSQKGMRPQEVVEKIFGVKNSPFLMAREEILFKENKESI